MVVKITVLAFLVTSLVCVLGDFNLTVVHISDFHSQWFEFDENKHDCSKEESTAGKCYGGFARLLTFVREIRKKEKNVLVLSSGEFFLGKSLNALHGWKMAHSLLPKLNLDAMSLSNHDFDSGVFAFSVFSYAMKFPILCANMVARNTSFLYSRVNKSVVLDVNGTKVGIVGYIHRHAQKKTKSAVSFNFVPEIPAIQEEVNRLENEGVQIIIALGHAGYHTDLEIVKKVKGVDIVMGGDSDIMLFDPGHDADEMSKIGNIHGNYPRIHHQEPESDNDPSLVNRTLVLHIPQHGMYIGVLRATFDEHGKIIHESGEPVLLDSNIQQDKDTLEFMEWAKGALEELNENGRLPDDAEILGVAKGHLDGNRRRCRMGECSLGNFIADAMLHEFTFHYRNKSEHRDDAEWWGPIDAVVYNSGTILRSIEPGYIKIKDLTKSIFLGGFVRRSYMSGQQVLDLMEHSVKHYDPSGVTAPGSFLQIGGMKVVYDLSQPPGQRVRSLTIRCRDCHDDNTYHPIVSYKNYVIGMPFFIHNGRDGFHDFQEPMPKDVGQFDVSLLIEHLRRVYEIIPKLDGRIKFSQTKSLSNSSFAPPLLFGETASEYNKIDGVFQASFDEQSSEFDKNEKNMLSLTKEAAERKNNNVNDSKKMTEPAHSSLVQEAKSFKNVTEDIDNILKSNQNVATNLSKENIQSPKLETINNNETSTYNISQVSELMEVLLNTSSRILNFSHENISEKILDLPGNSDFLKKIARNLTKRSIDCWLNDKGYIKKYSEFKNNISSFLESLDKCLRRNLSVNSSDSLSNELQVNSTESSKTFKPMKILPNKNSSIVDYSFGNISQKVLELPGSSDFLENISRNWMDDNGNIKNISRFLEELIGCLKSDLPVNSSDSEMHRNSTASDVVKTFEEIVKHILRDGNLNDLLKNNTRIMDGTTESNATDSE